MDYGICHLSYFPLRKEMKHQSENISQVLFGEVFQILDNNNDWYKIRLEFDLYEGWIEIPEMKFVNATFVNEIQKNACAYSKNVFTELNKKNILTIGMGSHLPCYQNGHFSISDEKYAIDKAKVYESKLKFDISPGLDLLGTPYLWGGKSSFGIDCSGFTQLIFKMNGIKLPRDAYQQAEIGKEIQFEEVKENDLAFFKNEKGRISHVGIVMPDDQILHASVYVRIDKLTKEGIYVKNRGELSHRISHFRRLINS
jgi:cell wall-associated NlpC family hydrolase